MLERYGTEVRRDDPERCGMLHTHELSKAVHADREREIRDHLPRVGGLASVTNRPLLPDSGVVEAGLRRIELRREPKPAFGG